MSIINTGRLAELTNALWSKITDKFNQAIINGRYDKTTKNIILTKGDTTETQILLNGVVDKWSDLEHVIEYPYANEMDYTQRIEGKWYPNSDGAEQENSHWSIYKHPVSPNDEYTLLRKYPDSGRIVFNGENNSVIEVQDLDRDVMTNGWYRQFITVPNNNAITHMAFCFQHGENPSENLILIKEGNVRDAVDSIPYLDGAKITIGESVTTLFDNNGTNLNSQTITGAIKELNGEVSRRVKTWSDLDYAKQYSIINLFNKRIIIDGQFYSGNGILTPHGEWCRFELPCQPGDVIKVAKKQHDSLNFMTLDENGRKIRNITSNRVEINGWLLYVAIVPSDIVDVSKISFNIHKPTNPIDDSVMIFRGNVNPPAEYVPYLGGKEIVIDSDHVILSFNNNDTNLAAITVDDAIRELDERTNAPSVGGVSREEFTQHVTDNEHQHQTFTSNISANTQSINTANQNITNLNSRVDAANNNISANAQSIASLDGSAAKKGSPNTFTSQNTFKNNSPVIDKYFPIKNIDADGIDGLYDGATYCCNPKQGIQNSFVSGLIVPIHNSQPGDTIRASYFTVNAATLRTTSGVLGEKDYTVQDVLYKGHYCIIIEVNNTFNYGVGFGFGITSKFVGSRRIGLLKTDVSHQGGGNIAWSSYNRPVDADNVSYLSGKFTIPYMITRKSTSEVVTRFDLANNTVPLNIYKIGELKAFAVDFGESIEIDGKTWLRCNGQQVQSVDHPELATLIGEQNGLVTLPSNSGTGYMYICVGV